MCFLKVQNRYQKKKKKSPYKSYVNQRIPWIFPNAPELEKTPIFPVQIILFERCNTNNCSFFVLKNTLITFDNQILENFTLIFLDNLKNSCLKMQNLLKFRPIMRTVRPAHVNATRLALPILWLFVSPPAQTKYYESCKDGTVDLKKTTYMKEKEKEKKNCLMSLGIITRVYSFRFSFRLTDQWF